ncbi:MAG: RHS domain-containing protein [Lentisphaerae bacterium]|nr:RHS domain-containing protein [Lentisphaerota bacterium]
MTYEPFGPVEGYSSFNGVATSVTRYLGGMVKNIDVRNTNTIPEVTVLNHTYGVGDDGNISAISGSEIDAQTGATISKSLNYSYDTMYRLTDAVYKQNDLTHWSEKYTYNEDGNRKKKEVFAGLSWIDATDTLVPGKNRLNEDFYLIKTLNQTPLTNAAGAAIQATGLNAELKALFDECLNAGTSGDKTVPASGKCEDAISEKLKALLEKYGIKRSSFDAFVGNSKRTKGLAFKIIRAKNDYRVGGKISTSDSSDFKAYISLLKSLDFESALVKSGDTLSQSHEDTYFRYDEAGNVIAEIVACQPEPHTETCGVKCYDHDSMGRLVTVSDWYDPNIIIYNESDIPANICRDEATKTMVAWNVYDYKNRRVLAGTVSALSYPGGTYFSYDQNDNMIGEQYFNQIGRISIVDHGHNEYVWLNDTPVAHVVFTNSTGLATTKESGGGGGCSCSNAGIAKSEVLGASRGVVFYYHTDHLNTPIKMTDEKGAVVWDVTNKRPFGDFDTYGKTVQFSSYTGNQNDNVSYTVENNLRFPGQYDGDNYAEAIHEYQKIGPYYNWNRWYNSNNSRYMEPDKIFDLQNSLMPLTNINYNYANDNSIMFYDINGLVSRDSVIDCMRKSNECNRRCFVIECRWEIIKCNVASLRCAMTRNPQQCAGAVIACEGMIKCKEKCENKCNAKTRECFCNIGQ